MSHRLAAVIVVRSPSIDFRRQRRAIARDSGSGNSTTRSVGRHADDPTRPSPRLRQPARIAIGLPQRLLVVDAGDDRDHRYRMAKVVAAATISYRRPQLPACWFVEQSSIFCSAEYPPAANWTAFAARIRGLRFREVFVVVFVLQTASLAWAVFVTVWVLMFWLGQQPRRRDTFKSRLEQLWSSFFLGLRRPGAGRSPRSSRTRPAHSRGKSPQVGSEGSRSPLASPARGCVCAGVSGGFGNDLVAGGSRAQR